MEESSRNKQTNLPFDILILSKPEKMCGKWRRHRFCNQGEEEFSEFRCLIILASVTLILKIKKLAWSRHKST